MQKSRNATASSKKQSKPGGQPNVAPVASKSGAHKAAKGVLAPGLYIVATPIGNLGDMTERAIATLNGADVVACEDTRVTAVLLRRYGITTPMLSYHDHNADRVRPQLMERLAAGEAIALVSDAGTPLISDPGYKLVRDCAATGIATVPLPGASALLAALVVAALPTDQVLFAGFLPAKGTARRGTISTMKTLQATLVFYESPQRLAESLADLAAVLGDRPAAVCRELTKLHEEVRRGGLADLAATYGAADTPKGEVVVVVGGAPADQAEVDDDAIDAALKDAMATMSVRDAAAAVATALGQPRRVVYAKALALAKK